MRTRELLQGVARQGWAVSELGRLTARKLFFDDNWSREAIAAHLSCSYMSVRTYLKGGKLTKKDRARLAELEDAQSAPEPDAPKDAA